MTERLDIPRTDGALLVLALSGAVFLAATTHVPTTTEQESRRGHVLPLLSLDSLERIEMSRRDESDAIVLRRASPTDRDAYFLGQSGSERADPGRVHELLATLDFTRFERKMEAPPPRSVLEQTPLIALTLASEQSTAKLEVLAKTMSSEQDSPRYYVRVADSGGTAEFGVIASRLVEALELTPAELRGPDLFPFGIEETKRLSFSTTAAEAPDAQTRPAVSLLADELGFFVNSQKDQTVRADRTRTDLTFFHLARSTLSSFLPAEEVQKMLAEAEDTVVIRQEGPGQTVVVKLGARCPTDHSAYLAWRVRPRPIAGCVPGSISPLLAPSFESYVDHTATVLTPDEIDHVQLVQNDRRVDVIRDGAGFLALHADRTPIDPAAANDFFEALSQGELSQVKEPSDIEDEVGRLIISGVAPRKALANPLPGKGTPSTAGREFATRQSLQLHRRGDETWLHRLDDATWWTVPDRLAWAFQADDTWSRDRKLTDFDAEDVERLRVTVQVDRSAPGRLRGSRSLDWRVQLVRTDEGFEMQTGQADPRRVRHFLDELTHLRAQRFETGEEDLGTRRLTVGWELGSGQQDQLTVGRRVRGGFLAQLESDPARFVLPVPTVTRLMLPLADRSPAHLAWEAADTITLSFAGRTTQLERDPIQWHLALGEVDGRLVEALEEAFKQWVVLARLPQPPTNAQPLLTVQLETRQEAPATETAADGSPSSGNVRLHILERTQLLGIDAYSARVEGETGTFLIETNAVEALFDLL